jgi:hypothetical protein
VNVKQSEETAQALIASDTDLLAMERSNGRANSRSAATATNKPPVSKRKIAISLSSFLKKQISSLALRRQDEGKQA